MIDRAELEKMTPSQRLALLTAALRDLAEAMRNLDVVARNAAARISS